MNESSPLLEHALTSEILHTTLEISSELVWTRSFTSGDFSCLGSAEKKEKYSVPHTPTIDYWTHILHPEDRRRANDSFLTAMVDKAMVYFEHEYRIRSKGKVFFILDKMKFIRNEAGDPLMVIGVWHDVTLEREREEALQQALTIQHRLNQELELREQQLRAKEQELLAANRELSDHVARVAEREFILNESQRLAKIGSWEYDCLTGKIFWSDEMYSIYGIDNHFGINDIEEIFSLYEPRSREVLRNMFVNMDKHPGVPFDAIAEVQTPIGYKKWVKIIGYQRYENNVLKKVIGLTYDITYFKEAEVLLKTSEEKFSKAFHSNPDPMMIVREEDMVIVDASENTYTLLGYNRREVIGRKTVDFHFFENPRDKDQALNEIHHKGRSEIECAGRTKSGKLIQVIMAISRIEIQDKKYLLIVIKDITDRKAAEEKFVNAFDLSPDLMVIVRQQDLVLVEANSKLEAITGYSKSEVLGKPVSNFPWWVNGKENDIFSRSQWGEAAVSFEASLKRKDNSRFFASVAFSDFSVSGERYIIAVIRDITEKRNAERKLTLSEANLKATINNTSIAVWSVDRDMRVIAFNDPLRKYILSRYGFELQAGERMVRQPGAPASFRTLASHWVNYYRRALRGETLKVSENHKGRIIDFSLNPIKENGKVMGVSVFAEDITNRIARESELAEAKSQVAEYRLMALRSAMNPHFIFNALNSIQFFIAGNDRRNAINYLSMFSKLIRGILMHSVHNKINLADELDLLTHYINLELLRFENKFKFKLEIDPSLDLENTDIPSLLIQPYVENAILHGLCNKEGYGILKLSVEQDQDGILVTIYDNGVGRKVAAELRQKLVPQHRSIGSVLTEERLKLINQSRNASVKTEDLFDDEGTPAGTKVKIWIGM